MPAAVPLGVDDARVGREAVEVERACQSCVRAGGEGQDLDVDPGVVLEGQQMSQLALHGFRAADLLVQRGLTDDGPEDRWFLLLEDAAAGQSYGGAVVEVAPVQYAEYGTGV